MQVGQILRTKGRDVVTIASDATLSEAARELARHRIGALIVKNEDGSILGVISERDIVRAVSESSVFALPKPVSAYMTRAVATCHENDTVDSLMETMTEGRFRHLPVVEDNRLVGIVSIGDVVKTRIAESIQEANTLREYIAAAR
jgi:CBS domain-containing protein